MAHVFETQPDAELERILFDAHPGSPNHEAAKYILEKRRHEREMAKRTPASPIAPASPDATRLADRIFIGHGHDPAWREVKDFVIERLGLRHEEFNREATAGKATVERIGEMLDGSGFALVVMTGEDERDGKQHARENVVHEAGLFQGRLGFHRAIILLEEGCEEFSNIRGLAQIRFPKGRVSAAFEEIRRTMEREGVIAPLAQPYGS